MRLEEAGNELALVEQGRTKRNMPARRRSRKECWEKIQNLGICGGLDLSGARPHLCSSRRARGHLKGDQCYTWSRKEPLAHDSKLQEDIGNT
jgi:hypothetical protein